MAVEITPEMHDAFTKDGFTEDDIQNTVNHYRSAGQSDDEIFSNLEKKYKSISIDEPQIEKLPDGNEIIHAGISQISSFSKGIGKGLSLPGIALGKNFVNKYVRPLFGKKPLSNEELNNAYGSLDDKPQSTSESVGLHLVKGAENTVSDTIDGIFNPKNPNNIAHRLYFPNDNPYIARTKPNRQKETRDEIIDRVSKMKKGEANAFINSFKTPEGISENIGGLLANVAMFGVGGKFIKTPEVGGIKPERVPKISSPKTAFDALREIKKQPAEVPKTVYEEMLGLEPELIKNKNGKTVSFQNKQEVLKPEQPEATNTQQKIDSSIVEEIPKEDPQTSVAVKPKIDEETGEPYFSSREDLLKHENAQIPEKEAEITKKEWLNQQKSNVEHPENPQFINTSPLPLDADTHSANLNFGKIIEDVRSAYSGDKNANIVRINQLSDEIRKIVPDKTQREALTLYRETRGEPYKLENALQNIKNVMYAPYEAQIKQALNPTKEMLEAEKLVDQYYKEAGSAGIQHGFLENLRRNYINRVWEKEPISKGKSMPTLNRIDGHLQKRYFENLLDGIKSGLKPASLDASDLMTVHGSEFSRTLANNKLVNALESVGLGEWKHPSDTFIGDTKFAEIERNAPRQKLEKGENGEDIKVPVLDKSGNQIIDKKIFTTPDWLANGMRSITDPNYLHQIDELRGLHKYQAFVKTVDLSMSLFHDFTFTMQWLYQHKFNPLDAKDYFSALKNVDKLTDTPNFKFMEQDFASNTGVTTKIHQNIDVLSKMSTKNPYLQKFLDAPGVKQFVKANETHSNYLFGKMQRWLKVTDYAKKCSSWLEKHPNVKNREIIKAKRSIARQINAAYGGLNWETLGATPSMVRLGQLTMLAPDWTYSNVELAKLAFEKSPAGDLARAHIGSALIGGGILTEGLNYILTGHFTDKNAKGHQFEVEVRPGVYVSFFRGGIGDFFKLGSNITENGVGGIGQFANGKLSPLMRAGSTALSGRNYFGQKVVNNGPFGKGSDLNNFQKSGNYFAAVGQNSVPIPFGANSAFALHNRKNAKPNAFDYALTVSGLARSGKPSLKSK